MDLLKLIQSHVGRLLSGSLHNYNPKPKLNPTDAKAQDVALRSVQKMGAESLGKQRTENLSVRQLKAKPSLTLLFSQRAPKFDLGQYSYYDTFNPFT